ncbi:YhcN/YlaJ family sporulation lipoprotein [Virgibacillus salexigens]|uniref:Sporulation lipoprotein, YhcN/YlaJ family n=1 Tax=Virgibacillus massiliensis TaxID=1462526 RepID=A0A024QBY3_9BACI|nr:YhcN/YlaJ family sporulation lipoprotein [Virgibacillus massiliensis]CDQ39451.1 sporulation lipoprotein, YhcN/YlaJ family [Virgibacillus massiliensis]
MRIKHGLILLSLLLVLTACATNLNEDVQEEQQQSGNTQPIHYETDQEKTERKYQREQTIGDKGGYPQTHQKKANNANYKNGYSDAFTNDEAIKLSNKLQNKREIVQAQVASTEKRIIVGVILAEDERQGTANTIKQEVKKIVPDTDKEIVVYTDDVHWDSMKNLDSRIKAKSNGEKIENIINNFIENNQ